MSRKKLEESEMNDRNRNFPDIPDIREMIQEKYIKCLECGGQFRQLTNTHLAKHDLTAEEYKEKWGYNRSTALMCRDLQERCRERALREGGIAERNRGRQFSETALYGKQWVGGVSGRLQARLDRTERTRASVKQRERRYAEQGYHPRERRDITRGRIKALWNKEQSFTANCRRIATILGCGRRTVARRMGKRDYIPKYFRK